MTEKEDNLQWDLREIETYIADESLLGNVGELHSNMIERISLKERAAALYEELKSWEEDIPPRLEEIMKQLDEKGDKLHPDPELLEEEGEK